MPDAMPVTPLLAPSSPLDARGRAVVAELHAREAEAALALPSDDPLDPKRRRRVELTKPETWDQPDAIRRTLDREGAAIAVLAREIAGRPIERVFLAGCGDSLAVMIGLRALFERLLGVPCEPVQALDFAYYHHCAAGPGSLLVALSSSGVTTRTVEALLLAKARGARVIAATNTPTSALAAEAHGAIRVHAERKGWPTQASTAAMAALARFALDLAAVRGAGSPDADALAAGLEAVPGLMRETLERHDGTIAALAEREAGRSMYLFAGAGPSYASALFGAAKMKECSPDHALAISLEEFHHYNSQKRGDPLFLLAPRGPSLPRALDTAKEGKRWGGTVFGVVSEGDRTLSGVADALVEVSPIDEALSAFVTAVPVQLFAFHVAMAKFARAELEVGGAAAR